MIPISQPASGTLVLDRIKATELLISRGFPLSGSTLEHWATRAVGPRFRIVNGRAVYRLVDLESWMQQDSQPAVA